MRTKTKKTKMSTSSNKSRIQKDVKDMKFIKSRLHVLLDDLTSEQYHGLSGTWSSSQFKDMLEDPDIFIRKYILKNLDREESGAFGTGTYFHTGVLEPDKMDQEIAVYDGKVRTGKKWDIFMAKHKGKTIVTRAQQAQGDKLVKAVKANDVAMKYLDGTPEISLFTQLVVYEGTVFAPHYKKKLTVDGWVSCRLPADLLADGYPIIVKVRADNLGENYISDLKSTSGNARNPHSVKASISKYKYDLSAALYLDMFSLLNPKIRKFYWIFASKSNMTVGTFVASERNIKVGRAKWMKAVVNLAECALNDWEVENKVIVVEPLQYELEWIEEKETDLF